MQRLLNYLFTTSCCQYAVPENIHTSSMEGIISSGTQVLELPTSNPGSKNIPKAYLTRNPAMGPSAKPSPSPSTHHTEPDAQRK